MNAKTLPGANQFSQQEARQRAADAVRGYPGGPKAFWDKMQDRGKGPVQGLRPKLDMQRRKFTETLNSQPPTLGMKENKGLWDKVDKVLEETWAATQPEAEP